MGLPLRQMLKEIVEQDELLRFQLYIQRSTPAL